MITVVHPTGNRPVRALLEGLEATGQLQEFFTTLAIDPAARWLNLLPRGVREELRRRSYPEVPAGRIHPDPWREIVRLAAGRLAARSPGKWASVDAIYRATDRRTARNLSPDSCGVYAYEDGADRTFAAAKGRGLRRYYDLPIAYWETAQRLIREEAERLPDWRVTLVGLDDPPEKLARKSRELDGADAILCPSRFVADSLPENQRVGKRVVVIPFGGPANEQAGESYRGTSGPLRVLFAGGLTQRKGLADLFTAVRGLRRPDIELVIMGTPVAEPGFYRKQHPDFTYEAPRPHAAVLRLMRSCDVLALPSIVEGRAAVLQEAMSQGLPLVITPNTGGEDLVTEGVTGFLIPIRAPESIAEKLSWMADHRAETAAMGRAAAARARTRPWSAYGREVAEWIRRDLAEHGLYNRGAGGHINGA